MVFPDSLVQSDMPYDDWNKIECEVKAGGWRCTPFIMDLMTTEIQQFSQSFLDILDFENPSSGFDFKSVEPWLELNCKRNHKGHLDLELKVSESFGQNTLYFDLSLDQTYFTGQLELLKQLALSLKG